MMSTAENQPTKPETEGVRDLVTPDSQQTVTESGDRSPKKTERDGIAEILAEGEKATEQPSAMVRTL
ncbi:MAG: hypothetical protein SFW36_14460, partial [Leptolyngbyaceae cyanobacterium bins.59]|nr:hypothetical protein [Leptolyngbyaceae cyanobacterium bins.59]